MSFKPLEEIDLTTCKTTKVLWKYTWSDGSKIVLTETLTDYVLVEYDTEGNPISYLVELPNKTFPSIEERWSKKRWTYDAVLKDIAEEYDFEE